jgi:hypothetical protein
MPQGRANRRPLFFLYPARLGRWDPHPGLRWRLSGVGWRRRGYWLNFELTKRLMLIPDSAARIARFRWTSGGILTINLPLYCLQAMGSGIASSPAFISATISETNFRIPFNAASGVVDSQLRLGSSAHKPTYSLSSSDHVIRYIYRSFFNAMGSLQFFERQQHLLHLIRLGFSLIILDGYSRVSLPGVL